MDGVSPPSIFIPLPFFCKQLARHGQGKRIQILLTPRLQPGVKAMEDRLSSRF
jgi:hypothetical protein